MDIVEPVLSIVDHWFKKRLVVLRKLREELLDNRKLALFGWDGALDNWSSSFGACSGNVRRLPCFRWWFLGGGRSDRKGWGGATEE